MDELSIYEQQLSQVKLEISSCSDNSKLETLRQLECDIKELIELTQEGLRQVNAVQAGETLDAEYDLFRAELALDEDNNTEGSNNLGELKNALDDLQEDLQALPGTKCQAPFKHTWCDEPVYHNALVFKVEQAEQVTNADDICVRVMFTNPTHVDMKPCPYFLEGECRFSKEKCRFSHGELVPFTSMKEFKEPNFSALQSGSRVLVKQEDGLWCRAIVQSVSDDKCAVKMESNSREYEVFLQEVFPLDGTELDAGSDFTSGDEDDESFEAESFETQTDFIDMTKMSTSSALGSWEQFTKGFGSRMMERMGYIHGAGLGAHADGRVEPVPAVVYPTGKSLDHCMMLKEKAGGDQDLFKAERKMRRMQKKHEDAMSRAYEKEKKRTDVFTFLNEQIGKGDKTNTCPLEPEGQRVLQSATQKGLNVSSLKIAEDVRRIEKEKKKLNESLVRHSMKSPAHAVLTEKIRECDGRLSSLQASEQKISTELQQRKDRKKLSVF